MDLCAIIFLLVNSAYKRSEEVRILPRDKSENNKKIISAATKEFLEQGFENASLRKIAADVGMTAGALYRHFANKEEMFAALVEPTLDELRKLYDEANSREYERLKTSTLEDLWENSESETKWLMRFIYDHFETFKLLVCCSQGTRYENFLHDMTMMEKKMNQDYFSKMKEYQMSVKELSEMEFHMLITANVSALFESVKHDFTKEQAFHYADTLDEFFSAGWKKVLGI